MKIIYLLPPSEGKNTWWKQGNENLSFPFEKPLEIAENATQKDLKCKWPAIERYSGVMYNAIDYVWMPESWKKYFEENFIILSGMYWLVKPKDIIWNYKLPIETKWLYKYWWKSITQALDNIKADYIVDMLPGAYAKMIDLGALKTSVVRVNFMHQKDWELKKISHGVKKVKWEYIKNICESMVNNVEDFLGEKVQISENEYHIQVISQ